jgi:hypothetical protein
VVQVEHLGVDLGAVDVEQRDLLPDAADQARVRDRRPDAAGADDGDLRSLLAHAGDFRASSPVREGETARGGANFCVDN